MKKYFGAKSVLYPEPVLMIGTYDCDGKANIMNAAWGGISDTNEIHICLSSSHKTTKNIMNSQEFTVSIGTKETVKSCDYVGLVSGNDFSNKLEIAGFHASKAMHINAPVFDELPFGLECKLKSYDSETGHLYAEIVDVYADESILNENKIDLDKFHPIIFDGFNANYLSLGEVVEKAFSIGKELLGNK